MNRFIVAIDGPAGSGKSTIAKKLAEKFELTYLDTGAMYRAITLYVLENKIDYHNMELVKSTLKKLNIKLNKDKCYLNDIDVSEKIREQRVSDKVSEVSSIKEIRHEMVNLQRKMSEETDTILDGRDIGTVVFPNADLKIFLTAAPEERAKRRFQEQKAKGVNISYEEVLKSINDRDRGDINKEEGALKKAVDAIEIDTTKLNIDEVIEKISKEIIKKKNDR